MASVILEADSHRDGLIGRNMFDAGAFASCFVENPASVGESRGL